MQWLDEASTALLYYATRLLSSSPVLFAYAARQREIDNNISALNWFCLTTVGIAIAHKEPASKTVNAKVSTCT